VDSPGGSYVASDHILRELDNAKAVRSASARESLRARMTESSTAAVERQAGKVIVVSMANVAAYATFAKFFRWNNFLMPRVACGAYSSGGYFIAQHADRIVALPLTVTGSIGVFAGKALVNGLADKVGCTFDEYAVCFSELLVCWLQYADCRLGLEECIRERTVGCGRSCTTGRAKSAERFSSHAPFPLLSSSRVHSSLLSPLSPLECRSSSTGIYTDFKAKAAVGRKMDIATVEKVRSTFAGDFAN